jgi:transcription termination factor NusA
MPDVTAVAGIGPATAKILAENGITTAEALAAVALDQLTSIPGFSEARAKTAIAAAKTSIESGDVKTPARAARKAVTKKTTVARKKAPARTSPPVPIEQAEADVESNKAKKHKKKKHDKKDRDGKSKDKKHKKNKQHKKDKKHKKGK